MPYFSNKLDIAKYRPISPCAPYPVAERVEVEKGASLSLWVRISHEAGKGTEAKTKV